MIAVTFALPAESSGFIRLLKERSRHTNEGVKSIRGQIHNRPVVLFHTGVGERHCRPRIENFLRQHQLKYLISAGFAGALNDELGIGSLLVSENYSSPELLCSPYFSLSDDSLLLGKLVTASGIIDSKVDRDRLAAESSGDAVDMETEFIAAACKAHRVPILSLRVISDTPMHPLPAPPQVLFDLAKQKTNFGRLAFYLATHPAQIRQLAAFSQRVVQARRSLTGALDQILRADLMGPMGQI